MNAQPRQSGNERDIQDVQTVQTDKSNRSPGPRRHRVVIVGIGALTAGLAIGIVLGAWAACGTQCGFDVQLFEAYGTWAGAFAAVAVAVIAGRIAQSQHEAQGRADAERAAAQARSDTDRQAARIQADDDREAARLQAQDDREAARRADVERAERVAEVAEAAAQERLRRKARSRALMCVIRATPARGSDHKWEKMHLQFMNPLAKDVVFSPMVTLPTGSSEGGEEQVWPGRKWLKVVTLEELGLKKSYSTAEEVQQAFNAAARDEVKFSFTLRGYRFTRQGSAVSPGELDPLVSRAFDVESPTEATDNR